MQAQKSEAVMKEISIKVMVHSSDGDGDVEVMRLDRVVSQGEFGMLSEVTSSQIQIAQTGDE